MSTWESLHKQHLDVFTKINLLEKALLNLLQSRTDNLDETASLRKDFLEGFKTGMILHFTVEEEALFPVLGKRGEATVSELLIEHKSMLEKYDRIMQNPAENNNKNGVLLELIRELAKHGEKEEKTIPPLVRELTAEQLSNIDQSAKLLGYRL